MAITLGYDGKFNLVLFLITATCFSVVIPQVINEEVNHEEIKCLVCQQIIKEIQKNLSSTNPSKLIEAGGYSLQENAYKKSAKHKVSESYLTELMEEICELMNDYVKAKHRVTGELFVMPLMSDGKMNSLMSEVDIVQDENLNKNLKLYCEEILEIHDENIIEHFQRRLDASVNAICKDICVLDDSVEKDEL